MYCPWWMRVCEKNKWFEDDEILKLASIHYTYLYKYVVESFHSLSSWSFLFWHKKWSFADSWWVNSNLVYVNAIWVIDCHQCYLGHYFSTTKDEALQNSKQVNSSLVYVNALWVVDCRRCYLDHCFFAANDEALQDSWRVNSNLIYVNALWTVDCRWFISVTAFLPQKTKFCRILDGWTVTLFTSMHSRSLFLSMLYRPLLFRHKR